MRLTTRSPIACLGGDEGHRPAGGDSRRPPQARQALFTLLTRESDPEMARQNLVGEATPELEYLCERYDTVQTKRQPQIFGRDTRVILAQFFGRYTRR